MKLFLALVVLVAAPGCKLGGDAENVANVSDLNQRWGALQGKKVQLTAEYGGLRTETVEGKTSYWVQAYDSAEKAGDIALCFIGHTMDEVRRANPDFDAPKNAGAGKLWGQKMVFVGTVTSESSRLSPCTATPKR